MICTCQQNQAILLGKEPDSSARWAFEELDFKLNPKNEALYYIFRFFKIQTLSESRSFLYFYTSPWYNLEHQLQQ